MSNFEATAAARSRSLAAIDWVVPDPGDCSTLRLAARDYRRELFQSMRHWARQARLEHDDELIRRTSLIMEAAAAGLSGNFSAACDLLIECRELSPGDGLIHLNSGVLLAKLGELDRARASLELAARIAPDIGAAQAFLTVVHTLKSNWSGAREAALRALDLGETLDGFVNLCLANACAAAGLPLDERCEFPEAGAPSDPSGAITPSRFQELARPAGDAVILIVAAGDQLADLQATVWSLRATATQWPIHVHLVTPHSRASELMDRLADRVAPMKVSWTVELLAAPGPGELRRHLRVLRLERLRDFLGSGGTPVVMLAPGVLCRRAPETWIAPSPEAPVCIPRRPDGLLWEQFLTDAIGVFPGDQADGFLREVRASAKADFMLQAKVDGLDQAAVWAAARRRTGSVRLLDPSQSLDPAYGLEAGAWSAGFGPESEAYGAWRTALLEADGDLIEPEPAQEPVNELLHSAFGPTLVNRNDLHITRSIRWRGAAESELEMDLLRLFIRPGDVVLDVGANIGTHTVPLCQAVGPDGRVLAFEPQRVIYQVMVANVALNSCLNADCRLAAVGDKPSRLQVPNVDYAHPGNFGMVSFKWDASEQGLSLRRGAQAAEEVEVITLDSLSLQACALIKIDVEGMEGAVLRGAKKTIKALRPIIYMECFDDELGFKTMAQAKAMGYRVYRHYVVGGENVLCIPVERDWGVVGLAEI